MKTSAKWRLNARDYVQGVLVSVLSSVGALAVTMLSNGGKIEWKTIGVTAIASAIGYLLKKLPQSDVQK
jgi:hypothetical protein